MVFRLMGGDAGDAAQVFHNAPHDVALELNEGRQWSVQRMLATMRKSPAPVIFGPGGEPALELTGYRFGAAAVAQTPPSDVCVVYFGRQDGAVMADEMFGLAGSVQLAAAYASTGVVPLVAAQCPLTQREQQCLLYYAADFTSKRTGEAMGISARTVEHHLERARVRLRVKTSPAALMLAIRSGWITMKQVQAAIEAA